MLLRGKRDTSHDQEVAKEDLCLLNTHTHIYNLGYIRREFPRRTETKTIGSCSCYQLDCEQIIQIMIKEGATEYPPSEQGERQKILKYIENYMNTKLCKNIKKIAQVV